MLNGEGCRGNFQQVSSEIPLETKPAAVLACMCPWSCHATRWALLISEAKAGLVLGRETAWVYQRPNSSLPLLQQCHWENVIEALALIPHHRGLTGHKEKLRSRLRGDVVLSLSSEVSKTRLDIVVSNLPWSQSSPLRSKNLLRSFPTWIIWSFYID